MLISRILLFLTLFSQKVLTRNPGSVIPELDNNSQWWNSWRRATQSNYYQLNHRDICGIRKIVHRQRRILQSPLRLYLQNDIWRKRPNKS